MAEPLPDADALLSALAALRSRVVLVSTGGGSRAVSHLLSTPGASAVVLECLVPYARAAVDGLLGGAQESYCSSRTARRLAVMAWQRACRLGADPETAMGAAVTASLRSREPKRGPHRIFVAVQSLAATSVATLELRKESRSRGEEETLAAALLLDRLATVAREAGGGPEPEPLPLLDGERVVVESCAPPEPWRDLLAGSRASVRIGDPGRPTSGGPAADAATIPVAGRLVFPGSFDPLHEGHLRMAVIAEEIAERPIDFELSVTNVDKPALDYLEMRDRAAQFTGRTLWLTRAATFLEKLEVFPESTFVMGADTFARLADPKYYGGSAEATARAVQRIAAEARGLIVFGREHDGVFEDPSRLDLPPALGGVTYFVSQREFRMDISSTQLRRTRAEDD
jgi:nicotinic acid mononucleotide adenylyltransferase